MSMAPDDGPLCPVVLWQTHQGWKLTNNGGRDWWELADLDLPEWLLVPRVEEAMALPRSDIPSWVQTPRRFVESLSDANTSRALCADAPQVAHDALRLATLMPEADAGRAEWCRIDDALSLIEQSGKHDDCWMGWLPSLAAQARMSTEPLAQGDLVGFGVDPRLRLRSACMVHVTRIADMAAAFGTYAIAWQIAFVKLQRETSCLATPDGLVAASDLLDAFAWKCEGAQAAHVRSLARDTRRILQMAHPTQDGIKLPYRKTTKLRRLVLQLLKPAREEMSRLFDQIFEEDRPIVALQASDHWADNGHGWQCGMHDESLPTLTIVPRGAANIPAAALFMTPPLYGPYSKTWRHKDSETWRAIMEQHSTRISESMIVGDNFNICPNCKCPLLTRHANTGCPHCGQPTGASRFEVDNSARDSRVVVAYFNSDQGAARAAIDVTDNFRSLVRRVEDRAAASDGKR